MAHAQKPYFVFRRNGRVHLYRWDRQFSRLLAAELCASAVVMLDTPCSEVVWRVLATHSIRQFPLQFPSRASPCAITFQLECACAARRKLDIWPVYEVKLYVVTSFLNLPPHRVSWKGWFIDGASTDIYSLVCECSFWSFSLTLRVTRVLNKLEVRRPRNCGYVFGSEKKNSPFLKWSVLGPPFPLFNG